MSFNKIIIVGNLGRDPDLRYTPQGTPVCSFTLATNEKRKSDASETVTWFRVTLWGQMAENANVHLTKGRAVFIEGRLRVEEWNDRNGQARYTLEVHATDMQFIGQKSEVSDQKSEIQPPAKLRESMAMQYGDEDVPF